MDAMKVVLLAGGGYLLYRYFYGNTAAAASSGSTGASATSPVTTGAPASVVVPVNPITSGSNIKSLVLTAAVKAGYPQGSLLNWWQWNYFYQQVRGVPAYDTSTIPNFNPNEEITLDEFWQLGAPFGLSGLGRAGYTGFGRAGYPGFGRAGYPGFGNYVVADGARF